MLRLAKKLVTTLVDGERLGRLEYHYRPSVKKGFGGPLNGSPFRQQTFDYIRSAIGTTVIIETGSFRGTTTEYFAATGLPVYSVESLPRFYGYTQARLANRPNAHIVLGDSRSFLKTLAADASVPKTNAFVYLDAHWYDDLPLRDEVSIIFGSWSNAVIMIDDFRVAGDDGYNYDDYGPDMALTLDYLRPIANLGFTAFFPTAPSASELFMKRGWVILANDASVIDLLRKSPLLREQSMIPSH